MLLLLEGFPVHHPSIRIRVAEMAFVIFENLQFGIEARLSPARVVTT